MDVEEAIASIEACDSHADLEACLQAMVEAAGFASYCFVDTSTPHLDEPFHRTTDDSWVREYVLGEFVHVDACVRTARRTNRAFTWSSVDLPPRRGRRKPGAVKVMEASQDHGFTDGFVIPFHYVDALGRVQSALCTLFWRDRPADLHRQLDELAVRLHVVLIYWMQRSIELRTAARQASGNVYAYVSREQQQARTALTDRERDVLSWAGRGKTVGETAEILSLSPDTVESHVRNAVSRLGAGNKTHAVAKAIYLGAIDI